MSIKNLAINKKFLSLLLSFTVFTIACSAQTEQQALDSLRQMTRDGKLPPESAVAAIETRFAGTRTGALAKLLRARVRMEGGDAAGAASLLNSPDFAKLTNVADHALWLRGKALQQAGDHRGAMDVFSGLQTMYPTSIRATQARLGWAASAIQAGRAADVPLALRELAESNNGEALLLTGQAYEQSGNTAEATRYYRLAYFLDPGTDPSKTAQAKLAVNGAPIVPGNGDEARARADRFFAQGAWANADAAYSDLAVRFPGSLTPEVQLRRLTTLANLKKVGTATPIFNTIPAASPVRVEAQQQMVLGFAKARSWAEARSAMDAMRKSFPTDPLIPKTLVGAAGAARDGRNKGEENYYLGQLLSSFPNAIEAAGAQFDSAWLRHQAGDFAASSTMLVDHLDRYAHEDTSNRGKAGYWAARDSERAGNIADACALYQGVLYRYSANWYGYLADQRLSALRSQGKCPQNAEAPNDRVARAVANLRTVTLAAETAGPAELERAEKSDQLSIVGLFDWAIEELTEARRTAQYSPKINLALARHYRFKGDNVNALLALAKSYPDYSQMFPEEMGREEWTIFYPHIAWDQITKWAKERRLDLYQVAGLIRQESVFNPRAKSHANAYGLMQLLVPTARLVGRKYGSSGFISGETLFQPPLNIELGTAYMRDQFDKFGKIEYVAVAYNAGPGRVGPWRASLPIEIDEFVEQIPFKETKGYVQGVIRNTAQYRRLYDEKGNFRPNVGTRPLRGEIESRPAEEVIAEFPDVKIDPAK